MSLVKDSTVKRSAKARGRWPDTEVIFDDNFDTGFEGWRDHMGGTTDIRPPLSRTALRTYDGSSAALCISAGPRANNPSSRRYSSGGTYKNLSRYFTPADTGYVLFESWHTLGGADLTVAPYSWFMGIDTQAWGDTHRGFYRMTHRRLGSITGTGGRVDSFAVTKDNASAAVIPDTGSVFPGDNENKMNFGYFALQVSLEALASDDALPGGYHSCRLNHRAYDLTGLGAGRGRQAPQVSSSFSGGLNFGYSIANPTGVDADGPSWLLVGRARGSYSKTPIDLGSL